MTFGEANRVLAVDDDAATLAFVSGVLERDGFLVDTACDGMEAIRKLGVHDYAAVVLDILMPRLDGFGVLSYITDRDPSLRQRIIVATALGDPKLGAPMIEGIHGFIMKPIHPQKLTATVRSCVEQTRSYVWNLR